MVPWFQRRSKRLISPMHLSRESMDVVSQFIYDRSVRADSGTIAEIYREFRGRSPKSGFEYVVSAPLYFFTMIVLVDYVSSAIYSHIFEMRISITPVFFREKTNKCTLNRGTLL